MTPYMKERQAKAMGLSKPANEKKVPVKIAQYSKKRQKENREYAKVSKPKWIGKSCEIRAPGCTGQAQGWNHAAGKENIEKLLDVNNGQPACNHCNTYIEANHEWAVKKGFRTKRNTRTKRYDNTYNPIKDDNNTASSGKGK